MYKDKKIEIVVALGKETRAIGNGNKLLWHIPDDMKRFRDITMGHPIIMGRKTYESLPEKYRPLPGRDNIIITRQKDYEAEGAEVSYSLEEALELARTGADKLDLDTIFIGGGEQIYTLALPYVDKLYLTLIESDNEGDTFFPDYSEFSRETFKEAREHEGLLYTWINLER